MHGRQPVPARPGGGVGRPGGVEAVSVVGDVQDDLVVEEGEAERGGGRARVLPDVGQGALGDAQQGRLDAVGQRRHAGPVVDVDADGEVVAGLPGGQGPQRRLQAAAAGEVGRGQVVDEAAGLGQVVLGDGGGAPDMGAGLVLVRLPDPLGGLKQHPLAGQALGETVVDLHRQPLALREGALAAFGGGEFAAGADQVVDQGALPGRLPFGVQEHGRGDRGDGGRGEQQVGVEPPARRNCAATTSTVRTVTSTSAARVGRVRSPV